MKASKKIKDERIIQLNNQIQSEAFVVVTILLALSIFIKSYILDMGYHNFITELIIMIISVIYLSIRGSMVGYSSLDLSVHGKKLSIISIFVFPILITIANGIRNYKLYGDKYTGIFDGKFIAVLGITFISSLIVITLILFFVSSVEKIGQKRLEKKIENDED